jgi:hypothetical protein
MKIDWGVVMYLFYAAGSLCFLAGTLIGLYLKVRGG